jgi:hypothetical protein
MVTSIKSNLPMRSPLLSQTCPYGHLYLAVICIKRSLFSCPITENFIWIEPLLRGHLSYKAIFPLSQRWPLNTGLTVFWGTVGAAIAWLYSLHLCSQSISPIKLWCRFIPTDGELYSTLGGLDITRNKSCALNWISTFSFLSAGQ